MFGKKRELTEFEKNHLRIREENEAKARELGISFTKKTTVAELSAMVSAKNRERVRESKGLV